jgi:integrase
MQAILAGLTDSMHRIAILIAAVTGLRRSEIRGLKWSDVDCEQLWLNLKRGVVRKAQTRLKTEGSRRAYPSLKIWQTPCWSGVGLACTKRMRIGFLPRRR